MAEFIERHRRHGSSWGRIVSLTSGVGREFPGEVSYGAAKAALISYTLSAASEMAADGVTANVVSGVRGRRHGRPETIIGGG